MDDLISRQALRSDMYHEAMEKDSDEQRWDGGCWIRYKMFERVIDRQPSAQPDIARDIATIIENEQDMRVILQNAQPERKKGKWVRHGIGHENVPWGFDCSACGEWFVIGDDTAERYNFCPNCGAEMEVEE